jgi:hypothetical protein
VRARRKIDAVRCAEIAPDPDGWIRALRVDVDRADAATAWLDADLPPPTFIIVRPSNGHAHLVWELTYWVKRHTHAERYFQRIRAAITRAVDGDPNYPGTFQHNPLHPMWNVAIGRARPYDLAELAQHVDLYTTISPIRVVDDDPASRNCTVFHRVRRIAYRTVATYRAAGDLAGFEAHIQAAVAARNADFPDPLPSRDVRSLAKSIANWTWARYARSRAAIVAAEEEARRSRAEYEAAALDRATQIRQLRADGLGVNEIARRLQCSRRLVFLRLKQAVQSPGLSELAPPVAQPADEAPPVATFPALLADRDLDPVHVSVRDSVYRIFGVVPPPIVRVAPVQAEPVRLAAPPGWFRPPVAQPPELGPGTHMPRPSPYSGSSRGP